MSDLKFYTDTKFFHVDDDPTLRASYKKMLLEMGFKDDCITQAHNGKHALEVLSGLKHDIDFFIFDIVMPEMNGIELIEKIRSIEKYKNTPILVLSSEKDKAIILSAIQNGANLFMIKGAPVQTFASHLVQVYNDLNSK